LGRSDTLSSKGALQIAFTTPIFEELGVNPDKIAFVWLAGPISGFLVQPVVGSLSDRCTLAFGRRRPFIVSGCVLVVIGLLLLSNAELIGVSLGPYLGLSNAASTSFSITIAVIGFWILDFANNACQGPARALIMDKAPAQQPTANAVLAVCLSLGNLSSYFLGSQGNVLLRWMPGWLSAYRLLFTLSAAILMLTMAVTCFVAKEKRHQLTIEQLAVNRPILDLPKALWSAIRTMPKGMQRVCLVQFMTWAAYFTFLIYMPDWMTHNVFEGRAASDDKATAEQIGRFNDGVRAGSLGLALQSVVTLIASAFVPLGIRCVGVRPVYAGGLFCLSLMLGCTYFVRGNTSTMHILAISLVAFSGVAWAVIITLPFTLVAETTNKANSGVSMGVMNVFIVIPQMVISLGANPIVAATNDSSVVMMIGSGLAFVGALLVIFVLITPAQRGAVDRLRLAGDGGDEDTPKPFAFGGGGH
jgi:solute carrier family 45 protein 1/2/4